MRTFLIGLGLGIAIATAAVRLNAQDVRSGQPYASASDVASALTQIGSNNGYLPVAQLAPYTVLAERRVAPHDPTKPAPIHRGEAELYCITEGAATLVTGRTPDQSSGGLTRHISKGDIVIIPQDTPHWFSAIDGTLSYISMHMPRSSN